MSVKAFVMTLFCFAALIFISWRACLDAMKNAQPHEAREVAQNGLYIKTIQHDGHMFVSAQTGSSYGAASIIHHPDCNCLKPKER